MKERPILFSGPMVRALLERRKTQTRRVVKPQPARRLDGTGTADWVGGGWWWKGDWIENAVGPYGVPGDRLWVRETWGYLGNHTCGTKHEAIVIYHADGNRATVPFETFDGMMAAMPKQKVKHPDGFDDLTPEDQDRVHYDLLEDWWARKKRIPSIHMYRWASRILLEVTEVRVERLQEIGNADARAEGCDDLSCSPALYETVEQAQFRDLWNSINAKRGHGWYVNPWVWVVGFRVLEPFAE